MLNTNANKYRPMHFKPRLKIYKPEGLSVLSADGPGFKAGFALAC
jgi:hypothetical protein